MRGKKVGRGMGIIGRCPSPLESYPQMWTMAGDIRLRADRASDFADETPTSPVN